MAVTCATLASWRAEPPAAWDEALRVRDTDDNAREARLRRRDRGGSAASAARTGRVDLRRRGARCRGDDRANGDPRLPPRLPAHLHHRNTSHRRLAADMDRLRRDRSRAEATADAHTTTAPAAAARSSDRRVSSKD